MKLCNVYIYAQKDMPTLTSRFTSLNRETLKKIEDGSLHIEHAQLDDFAKIHYEVEKKDCDIFIMEYVDKDGPRSIVGYLEEETYVPVALWLPNEERLVRQPLNRMGWYPEHTFLSRNVVKSSPEVTPSQGYQLSNVFSAAPTNFFIGEDIFRLMKCCVPYHTKEIETNLVIKTISSNVEHLISTTQLPTIGMLLNGDLGLVPQYHNRKNVKPGEIEDKHKSLIWEVFDVFKPDPFQTRICHSGFTIEEDVIELVERLLPYYTEYLFSLRNLVWR